MMDDCGGYQFLKNRHHLDVFWGTETLKKSVAANEKLPLYQLIRYSEFLDTRHVLKLEIESSTDEKVKYRVKLLWDMLSKVYACDDVPTMLKLVNFWTEQRFFEYKFDIEPLQIESFELLLNQELFGTIAMGADSIYLNKAILQSNLLYITVPNQYRKELLKILCECFSDANKLLGSIEKYICEVTTLIEGEFGKAKTENILRLFTSEFVITNSNAEKMLGSSTKTAIGYLKTLEHMKLLKAASVDVF